MIPEQTTRLNLKISPDFLTRIDAAKKETNEGRNNFIIRAIENEFVRLASRPTRSTSVWLS